MRLLLLLCCADLCLPGWALRGPSAVTGNLGGSLSVSCSYQEGYETYPKYWCYPSTLLSCSYKTYIVITSEQQPWAQRGRTSIWDNRTQRVFTVTMKDLTAGDAGTYICGVRRHLLQQDVTNAVWLIVLSDTTRSADAALPPTTPRPLPLGTDAPMGTSALGTDTAPGTETAPGRLGSQSLFPVLAGLQVLALLAMSAAVLWLNLRSGYPAAPRSPAQVLPAIKLRSGPRPGSVLPSGCHEGVQGAGGTSGPEFQAPDGSGAGGGGTQSSAAPQPRRPAAGGAMRLLLLLCCADLCLLSWALQGPSAVTGNLGGSLSVSCSYQEGYETYPKYWCHPGTLLSCSYKTYIVITSEQQPWVQRGRTSIWDNRTQRVFTVTMKDLTAGDAGTYICGVRRHLLQQDVTNMVRVTVLSGSTWMSPQQETAKQTARPTFPGDLSAEQLDIVVDILIPCIAVVLFLLALSAAVLVILSRKRKKALAGASIEMCSTRGTANSEVLQYADISHVGTEQSQLYSNVRAVSPQAATEYSEVKKPGQNLAENAETLYTQVCKIPLEEQEQLYANMAPSQQRAAQ
ncbi:uncharacterized protein [Excalfactoria chinensis]|uniref:uncharacterized protein isoform X2 n=1 Tax=Excalfactoria chinensis TaxID=46218 RepID=UPI003B3A140C